MITSLQNAFKDRNLAVYKSVDPLYMNGRSQNDLKVINKKAVSPLVDFRVNTSKFYLRINRSTGEF